MPGPLTVVVLHGAITSGPWAGPLAAFGHGLLELVMVFALAAGLGRLLRRRGVAALLAVVGGAALVWMGWEVVQAARAATVTSAVAAGPGGPGPFVAGAMATLGNPYWFLWWATVGASQLAWAGTRSNRLVFWAGHVAADMAWLTLLGVAAAGGSELLSETAYRAVLCGLGAAVALLGLCFVAAAGRLWRQGGA